MWLFHLFQTGSRITWSRHTWDLQSSSVWKGRQFHLTRNCENLMFIPTQTIICLFISMVINIIDTKEGTIIPCFLFSLSTKVEWYEMLILSTECNNKAQLLWTSPDCSHVSTAIVHVYVRIYFVVRDHVQLYICWIICAVHDVAPAPWPSM